MQPRQQLAINMLILVPLRRFLMRFHNILFPVDFSARSHAAVPHVRAMAEHFGASVTLLHVVEGPAAWAAANDGGYFVEFDLPRLMKEADERLAASLRWISPLPAQTVPPLPAWWSREIPDLPWQNWRKPGIQT